MFILGVYFTFVMVTKTELKHLAKLAKLHLGDEKEVEKFTHDISRILEFVGQLQEVDTKSVQPTFQVTGLQNVMRNDEIEVSGKEAELLECSVFSIENNSLKIPKIL